MSLEHIHSIDVAVVNTAGAGDAFVAGTIVGLIYGLPFLKGTSDESFGDSRIKTAPELGTILANISVMSKDTIAFQVNRQYIKNFINQYEISEEFRNVLQTSV